KLRQKRIGPAAAVLRYPQCAGHLDCSPVGDGRLAPGQPYASDARQARIQRADEGRGLHAPGDPSSMTRLRAAGALGVVCVLYALYAMLWTAPVHAQTFSQRGFVDVSGVFFPQEALNDPTRAMGDLIVREEVFVKPAQWVQLAAGLDLRANSHDQVDESWRV